MELLTSIVSLFYDRAGWFLALLGAHISLAFSAIFMAGVIGLVLGILISEKQRFAPAVMGVCNVLYTIPSISLLGILIPFTGIGNNTAFHQVAPAVYDRYGVAAPVSQYPYAVRGLVRIESAYIPFNIFSIEYFHDSVSRAKIIMKFT